MSNQGCREGAKAFRGLAMLASSWNSVLGTLGLAVVGFVLFLSSSEPAATQADEPRVTSRTVIHWRQNPVFSLAWSHDSRRLAASCFGPTVRVWDREEGTVTSHEGGTEQPRFALGWSDDGRRLMVSGLDLPIEVWEILDESPGEPASVSRPADPLKSTNTLIRTTAGRPIRLWGPSDKRFGLTTSPGRSINSIAFSADGRFMAAGGLQGRLEIREPGHASVRQRIEVDPRGITSVTFSPDSLKVATSGPGPVRIWDVATGREDARLGTMDGGSAALGFSPNGSRMAIATWDGTIQVWDLATRSLELKLRGHQGQILSLAWSPDGKSLASGGYDSTVRVWDMAAPPTRLASR